MKKRHKEKLRSDHPSGRQASEQPEHSKGKSPEVSTLHQGQGPDFVTQDKTMQNQNEGIKQLYSEEREMRPSIPHQQPAEISCENTVSSVSQRKGRNKFDEEESE